MGLVATKLLVPPARPGQVPRTRLHDRLSAARSRTLTVVTAPAGFGKTTLVSTWLRAEPVRSAWITLDEDDDVPGRVLEYLLAAMREVGEPAAENAQALLDSGGPAASVLAVLTTLINDLAKLTSDLVLVVDDFHVLTQPEILDAAAFLVDRCPPRLHLILLSRQEPPLPLSRWRAAGRLAEIGTAQLRFTPGEAAELLRSVAGAPVDDGTAADLERRTEGWAAGLQLFGIGLRDGAATSQSAPAVGYRPGDRYVLDYLADEVLRGQPPEVRTFLRRTAILDTLTASLCDAVTGRTDGAAMIDRLERDNLFLTPLDDAGRWHRYHGLFADYLRAELDPAEAADCHARAARWYRDRDVPAETIKHAVAAGDPDLAADVIGTVAEDEIRRGELATLLGWLNRLPDKEVRSRAVLAGLKGWLLYLGGHVEAADSYARLADERMPVDARAADRAMLRTFQAYLALTRNEPAKAAELATEVLDLLGEGSTSFFRAAALGVLGQARRRTGDRRGAIEVLRAAVTLGERSGNPLSALEATGYLAPLLFAQGRLREAIVLCADALQRNTDRSGRPLPMAGLAEVPLGTLRYERDDLDAAARHLVDGIARCEQMGTTSYSLLGLRTLARLHVTRGDVDDGFRALLAARRLADAAEDHRRARLVVATTAELHLRTGNRGAAEEALRELADSGQSTSDHEVLAMARLWVARDEPDTALRALSGIEEHAVREGRDGSLIAILTVTARAHAVGGATVRARDALARAVRLAAPDGYRRTFLDEGPALAALLRDVQDVAPAFVTDLRTRLRAHTTPERSALRTVPEVGVIQPLTDTQRRILDLIATGMSNQQVADRLFITVGTTKWHLNQIYGRLQARNRTEAVARARELHLL